jgi:hypothetical protein
MRNKAFKDRAFTYDRQGIYTTESISANQETTPEGFLLCRNVAIARTGDQMYLAEEIGLEGHGDGLVKIQRHADEVFNPITIASFEGKPVTINHPDGTDVNPSNWRDLTVGIVQNVRQGDGIEDDLLFADLLITDQRGIEAIRNKKMSEVSCGYDADYEQIEIGLGRQANIMGNHVALVERGRAGSRCSIRDEETVMKTKKSFIDKLRAFLDSEASAEEKDDKTNDADPDDQDNPDQKTADSDDPYEARFTAIENGHAEIMKSLAALSARLDGGTNDADPDDDEKTQDADPDDDDQTQDDGDLTVAEKAESNPDAKGLVLDTAKNIIAKAEILAPGIKVPTGDAIGQKGAMDKVMIKALSTALDDPSKGDLIKPLLLGRQVGKLTGDSLKVAFFGASELIKAHNNAKGVRSSVSTQDFGRTVTPASINEANRKAWANK